MMQAKLVSITAEVSRDIKCIKRYSRCQKMPDLAWSIGYMWASSATRIVVVVRGSR
jgi:hypothetical protein